MKKIIFFLLAYALTTGSAAAQQAADSVKIYYRRGYSTVDPAFRDNEAQLERLLGAIEEAAQGPGIEKIVIRSYASPEGKETANRQLAARRAEEMKAYLVREAEVPAALIEHRSGGVAWDMLRKLVAESDMSGRDQVLEILDNTPVWIYDDNDRIVDGRKKRLMDLQGGRPYNYMLEHLFPELRNSVNTVIYLNIADEPRQQRPETAEPAKTADNAPAQIAPATPPVRSEAATSVTTVQATDVTEPARPAYPKNIVTLHAGYCHSWITSYGLASSTRPGYEAGITDRIRLGRQLPLYLRTGLSFTSNGYEVNGFDDSRTTLDYLMLPVGIDYTIALGQRFSLIPTAGLYYAVGIGGKRTIGDDEVPVFSREGGFSRHDMGFSCGIDAAIGRFIIGAGYRVGLIDIDKNDTVYGDDSQMIGYKHVRNHCFVVGMGISF